MTKHAFESVSIDDLTTVNGGFGQRVGFSTGSGPMTAMGLLDKPGKTLGIVGDALGIPSRGNPGDRYTPASMNSNGSITQGRFDAPNPSGVSVPMSQ